MSIVFFCQSCGARFEVAPRLAGKRGHCKKCGQIMTIPRAEEIASMTAIPALAVAGVGASRDDGAVGGASIGAILRAGISQALLAPITLDRAPAALRRPILPSALDDAADSKPYVLAAPIHQARGPSRGKANVVVGLWRRQLGGLQKVFRGIAQTAYLVSVPFLLLLVFGAITGSRQLALLGATAVVLLNIGRLVAGTANLAVVPFRDGVNVGRMKKPARQLIEPAMTIGLVVLAFTFVPSLSRARTTRGNAVQRITAEARDLGGDIKGQVGRVVDMDKLGAQAQEKFKELRDKAREIDVSKLATQAQEKLQEIGAPSGGDATGAPKPGGERP